MKLSEAIREWKRNINTHMAGEYVLTLRADINAFSDAAQALERENAKLREVCKEMSDFVLLCCGECDVSDISSCTHSECDAKKAWIHTQELGIEVE